MCLRFSFSFLPALEQTFDQRLFLLFEMLWHPQEQVQMSWTYIDKQNMLIN